MVLKKSLFILSFLLLSVCLPANNVYFKHLNVNDGLSQINILSIYQDETGALWFGTFEGLNRYNGEAFTIFPPSQFENELSQNEIMAICGDKKGNIYIQALHDLIHYDVRLQKFQRILSQRVFNIHYHNDTLWIVTDKELLYSTDQGKSIKPFVAFKKQVEAYSPLSISANKYIYLGTNDGLIRISLTSPKMQETILSDVRVTDLHQDHAGNLWVCTSKNGLFRLSPDNEFSNFKNNPLERNSISNNDVRCIVEDNFHNLWIGTFGGLNKYTPSTNQWENYVHQPHVSYSLSHSSIFAIHKDTQGGIWIGTYYGGINYFNPTGAHSNFYEADPENSQALSSPYVGKIQEDNKHNLWICTEGGGLNHFDRQTHKFTHFTDAPESPTRIGHNNLKSLWFQKESGKLYIGTHRGGLTVFDTRNNTAHTLKNIPGNSLSLPNDVVNGMQYHKGKLIVATQSGIFAMNPDKETFSPLSSYPNIAHKLNYIYESFHIDAGNNIWLAHGSGGVSKLSLNDGSEKDYIPDGKPGSIGRFKILHIAETRKGELFFCTAGSGVYKYNPQTDTFTSFSAENNLLPSNYCYYAIESPTGELVVLHTKSISYLDTKHQKLTYTQNIPQMSFCQSSSIYFTQDGELFLGGINGILALSNKEEVSPIKDHSFYFDKLIINNKLIQPGDDSHILSAILPYTEKIDLKHDENNLALEFATSNYIQNKYKYEYQLKGFDKTWLPLHSSRLIYTNLDPGSYRLVVRELDNKQTVCGEIALDIHIHPPFYANPIAYVVYFLLASSLFIAITRFNKRQAQLKASLEFERKEKERIKELNQTKLQFFTNISHEFRTPLTLIIGQIESLLQLSKLPPVIYNRMLRIYKNANHMRGLISELLDFRKQEQGHLKVKAECHDIIAFTKEIYISFYEYALKHHITYKFKSDEMSTELWFDPVQMQKVIFNLLSNAFKYTPPEGTITVAIHTEREQVAISVRDNGSGIPQESIQKIFERFYQIDGQSTQFSLGTGIGLALTKNIVELHKGTIHVESEVNKGSCFTVTLQKGNSHFSAEDMTLENRQSVIDNSNMLLLNDPTEMESQEEAASLTDRPSILLVEDNEDILEMLKEIFCPIYEVHTAVNGREGYEQALKIQPDIVLSDVMMPEMSGKEMCHKIKNSIALSHIPVVLLTAQTSIEYTIEGFMYGADDYITKPFNVKVLISRCNNLVKTRRALMEIFRSQQQPRIAGNAINQADQELINKTSLIIAKNFENPEFNMNSLAAELGLGRNKLFARIKELTGLTPNELTLKMKLDESIRLLNEHAELNISEISDRLGFSSTQYFSKCFKSIYGVSPLNFRKTDSPAQK